MSSPITLMTSHSLDGPDSEANSAEQRRFTEFVTARRPELLDFRAYVSEDNRQLKLLFVFPGDAEPDTRAAVQDARDRRFRDSGLAGLLAAAAIAILAFAAAYLGSIGAPAG